MESEAELDTSRQCRGRAVSTRQRWKQDTGKQGEADSSGQPWGNQYRGSQPVAGSLPGHARAWARRPPSPGSQQCDPKAGEAHALRDGGRRPPDLSDPCRTLQPRNPCPPVFLISWLRPCGAPDPRLTCDPATPAHPRAPSPDRTPQEIALPARLRREESPAGPTHGAAEPRS